MRSQLFRPIFCPEPWSVAQTDWENRVVGADHCIIHALAMAPSSVRMVARPWNTVMGRGCRNKAVYVPYLRRQHIKILSSWLFLCIQTSTDSCLLTSPHPIYVRVFPPTPFLYLLHSPELFSTFPFHPLSCTVSPRKVDLQLSLLRLLSASCSILGTKGVQNGSMSLYSACAQIQMHKKGLAFSHHC